ncbi:hypothetical protein IGL98_003219 [Enterococcus sp. DIV0840]|uniref:hypothetical protein n=1 Tax=unclassified Enterococcus TaxID=2608891 RepID=UPI001A8BF8E0|nr:hypothetical protein [Enterococcus sp. DIV0849a]MBO0436138.1 hypothetical protein [Enterococcus sp. DIV0849a]
MSNRRKKENTCNELVVVMSINVMRFIKVQAFCELCRNLNNYSVLFFTNEENLLASCLKENPRDSVFIFNLEIKYAVFLKEIFTCIKVNKLQLEDYYVKYEETK